MKKSCLMMASALVLTMAVAATAEARDGFYIAVRGGYTDFNVNSKEDSAADSAKVELDSGWHMSGALGYKFGYFRVEGEYIYRDKSDDEYPEGLYGGHKTVLESDSFMANAYLDIMPNYWISPYVTGGIGLTRLDLETHDYFVGGSTSNHRTEDADNFTWQVGAGLSLRLNRCLNLDAGYRYIDMGEIDDADINAHEWYGGLRYTF